VQPVKRILEEEMALGMSLNEARALLSRGATAEDWRIVDEISQRLQVLVEQAIRGGTHPDVIATALLQLTYEGTVKELRLLGQEIIDELEKSEDDLPAPPEVEAG